jgi:inorganic pyrophosphatase
VNLFNIPTHSSSPRVVNAVVEIGKGSSTKYEYDEDLGVFKYDRSLDSAMVYPANYGSIPGTLCDDGDPLDILILSDMAITRGTVVDARPLGVLDMDDEGAKDYKVLAVPVSTRRRYRNLNDVDPLFRRISKNFFAHYKDLENKNVTVGEWLDKQSAYKIIKESIVFHEKNLKNE